PRRATVRDGPDPGGTPAAAGGRAGEPAGEPGGRAGETVGRASGLRRRRGQADIEDEPDGEERGNGHVRRERPRASEEPDEYDEPADEYEEEDLDEAPADEAGEPDDEEPAPRRRRSTRSPVVRARRGPAWHEKNRRTATGRWTGSRAKSAAWPARSAPGP